MNDELLDESLDLEYEYFKKEFELLTNINLSLYKEKQMKRRINTLIEKKKLNSYNNLLDLMKANSHERDKFIDYITINVSSFFRTSEHWKVFEDLVLKSFVKSNKKIRIWSCATSTGEEAYSLAISLLKISQDIEFEIIASDIDESVLIRAESGIYKKASLEEISDDIINDYFDSIGEYYIIKDEVRSHVNFCKIDLFKDDYPLNCDVIVCRNVLIYFNEDGKEIIYNKIINSLNDNCYLFTGNVEQIVYYKKYGFKKINNYIYCKDIIK